MSELTEIVKEKAEGYLQTREDGIWFCLFCSNTSESRHTLQHMEWCLVGLLETVQAALSAHEAEHKALVAIKDVAIRPYTVGRMLFYLRERLAYRESNDMTPQRIEYCTDLIAALESYQAATE